MLRRDDIFVLSFLVLSRLCDKGDKGDERRVTDLGASVKLLPLTLIILISGKECVRLADQKANIFQNFEAKK